MQMDEKEIPQAEVPENVPEQEIPVQNNIAENNQDQNNQDLVEYLKRLNQHKYFAQHIHEAAQQEYSTIDDLHPKLFRKNIQLRISSQSINKEILFVQAYWGYCNIKIKILNIKGRSKNIGKLIKQGSYGSIYLQQFMDQQFIMKQIQLNQIIKKQIFKDKKKQKKQKSKDKARKKQASKNPRKNIIQEFVLTKICSVLGIGAKVVDLIGFDLLMFENSCVFAIEKCQQVSSETFQPEQLYNTLAALHRHNIVHQDIKPQNIMYSPYFKRLVLIDFGLSTFIREDYNQKTMTTFVGTYNFVNKQMQKLWPQNADDYKKGLVNLYVNDYYGLKESIKHFRKYKSDGDSINEWEYDYYSSVGELTQEKEQIKVGRERSEEATFFFEVRMKYYLYDNYFLFFKETWNQMMKMIEKKAQLQLDPQNKYLSKQISRVCGNLLEFMEELNPTNQLTQIVQSIIPLSFTDTELYKRIRIEHDISQKSICKKEITWNKQKYDYFNIFCQEIQAEALSKQSIRNVIFDKIIGTMIPHLLYFNYYLNYISYFYNCFEIDEKERVEAAQAYYRLFYNEEPSDDLKGRNLVSFTILHCLQSLLNNQKFIRNRYVIANLILKVYDFLFILDFGTSTEYISWLKSIINHWSFQNLDIYIFTFVQKVKILNMFNSFRKTSRRDVNRIQFYETIKDWVEKNQIKNFDEMMQSQIKKKYHYNFRELNRQIFMFAQFQKYRLKSNSKYINQMINLLYNLNNLNSHTGIFVFFPELFKFVYLFGSNKNIIPKQLVSIWHDNIRDREIQNQFIFDFFLSIGQTITKDSTVLDQSSLKKINDYFKQFDIDNLYLFLDFINALNPSDLVKQKQSHILPKYHSTKLQDWQSVKLFFQESQKVIQPNFDYSFLYLKDGYFSRFFDSFLISFRRYLKHPQESHICNYIEQIDFGLRITSGNLDHRVHEIYNLVDEFIPQMSKKCHNCYFLLINYQKLFKLKLQLSKLEVILFKGQDNDNLSEGVIEINMHNIQDAKKLYDDIVVYCKNLTAERSINKIHNANLQTTVLQTMAIFSNRSQKLEHIFKGLHNFYKILFVEENIIETYFSLRSKKVMLISAFAFFYKQLLPELICKLSQFIHSTLNQQKAQLILWDFNIFVEYQLYSVHNIICFFQSLRKFQEREHYLILFYVEIMMLLFNQPKTQRKILKVIGKKIDKLHFHFRRQVGLSLYIFSLYYFKEKGPRYKLHYTNALVKHAMASNKTQPFKRQYKTTKPLKMMLLKKMSVYEKYSDPQWGTLSYTFEMNKTRKRNK